MDLNYHACSISSCSSVLVFFRFSLWQPRTKHYIGPVSLLLAPVIFVYAIAPVGFMYILPSIETSFNEEKSIVIVLAT